MKLQDQVNSAYYVVKYFAQNAKKYHIKEYVEKPVLFNWQIDKSSNNVHNVKDGQKKIKDVYILHVLVVINFVMNVEVDGNKITFVEIKIKIKIKINKSFAKMFENLLSDFFS